MTIDFPFARFCSLLRWQSRLAEYFVEQLTVEERHALEHHVETSSLVGVAAVIYRARVRMADGDRRALALVLREASKLQSLVDQPTVADRCEAYPPVDSRKMPRPGRVFRDPYPDLHELDR